MHGLTVITGAMWSGKTTEMERRLRRAALAGCEVFAFCHKYDIRYSETPCICTHDGQKICAEAVDTSEEFFERATQHITDFSGDGRIVIGIDEVHFFEPQLAEYVEQVLDVWGAWEVIVAGLSLDSSGKPFQTLPDLMARADKVIMLRAVCKKCGEDATRSFRITSESERIVVGSEGCYESYCRKCFYEANRAKAEKVVGVS